MLINSNIDCGTLLAEWVARLTMFPVSTGRVGDGCPGTVTPRKTKKEEMALWGSDGICVMSIRQGRSYMMRNGRAVAVKDNTEGQDACWLTETWKTTLSAVCRSQLL